MSNYKFSKQQEQTIAALGQRIATVAALITLAGVSRIVLNLMYMQDGVANFLIAHLMIAIINIGVGILLFRPSNKYKQFTTAKGNDIKTLMSMIDGLAGGFKLVNGLLIVVVVLGILALFVG